MELDKRSVVDLTRAITQLTKALKDNAKVVKTHSTDSLPAYPFQDGEFTILGPECFAAAENTVISWQGSNFYKACDAHVVNRVGGGQSFCVKRVGHPGKTHEAYDGTTRDEL